MNPTRRPLGAGDWPAARSLAEACGLPVADLEPGRQSLWGAWDQGLLVGVIGAEVYSGASAPVALVRSMAVDPGFRSQGLAGALFSDLEAWWDDRGPLVLLTETAEGWFARRGFVLVPRDDLPGAVKASAEFQDLCPVSARAMVRPCLSKTVRPPSG